MPICSGVLHPSLSSGVFSENVPDRYSHPGFMRGEGILAVCATLSELSRTVRKTAQYPPGRHKPQPTVKRVEGREPLFATLINDRMAGGERATLRRSL